MEPLDLLVGRIAFDGRVDDRRPLVWGGPLPSELASERSLLQAGDPELRALDGLLAALAAKDDRGRLVSGVAGIATLHRAADGGIEAFSTHAVAAAWLAAGRVSIAAESIPELIAHDYVGGEQSLIAGVRVLPPAMRIDFTPDGTNVASYWPASERWERLPEDRAYDHAERSLLDSLARRASGGGLHVALTGGLDSRVVALALHELGRSAGTFTWGEPGWDDVETAARIAQILGFEHVRQPVDYREDAEALRQVDSEVRWTEGITAVRFAAQTWPREVDAVVYGSGGEIGRAFHYGRELARAFPTPSEPDLRRVFDGRARLHGAHREALGHLRNSEREWIAAAGALGATGWRCLDVVYAEQRVHRWGRSQLPRLEGFTVPAFVHPEIARALVSLPLADRVTDAFHRRFLARLPALAVSPPPPLHRQSPLRRALTRVPAARRALMAWRQRRGPGTQGRWPLADAWPSRPLLRSWIAEEALGSALIAEALGPRWASRTRAGFMEDQTVDTQNALLAAAPYSLQRALQDLNKAES